MLFSRAIILIYNSQQYFPKHSLCTRLGAESPHTLSLSSPDRWVMMVVPSPPFTEKDTEPQGVCPVTQLTGLHSGLRAHMYFPINSVRPGPAQEGELRV